MAIQFGPIATVSRGRLTSNDLDNRLHYADTHHKHPKANAQIRRNLLSSLSTAESDVTERREYIG